MILAVISIELGLIMTELMGVRREQVKNAAYTLTPEQLSRLRESPNSGQRIRALEGQVKVDGQVEIDDALPVHVSVEEWNAMDTVAVENER